jgi:NADPH-dependent curcumin reductase CurA
VCVCVFVCVRVCPFLTSSCLTHTFITAPVNRYGGLLGVLRPKPRAPGSPPETIWVSGAAGAVGSLVGQIAKNVSGCRVIGSCGGPDKVRLVTEKFGFDAAVDYKKASNADELAGLLNEVAPNGIDMYFDNVGGMHFEAAMKLLRPQGRVAICGAISRYNEGERQPERWGSVH